MMLKMGELGLSLLLYLRFIFITFLIFILMFRLCPWGWFLLSEEHGSIWATIET